MIHTVQRVNMDQQWAAVWSRKGQDDCKFGYLLMKLSVAAVTGTGWAKPHARHPATAHTYARYMSMESFYFQIIIGSFLNYFKLLHQLYRLCRMWKTNQGCDSGYGPLYFIAKNSWWEWEYHENWDRDVLPCTSDEWLHCCAFTVCLQCKYNSGMV